VHKELTLSKTILIVDDSSPLRRLLADFIKTKFNFKTYEAENGQEALDAIDGLDGKIDLIFLDIDMPIMDGITFIKKFKSDKFTKSIPIICLTAKNDKATVAACIKYGVNEYIAKPYDLFDVAKKVNKALGIKA